MKRLSKAELEQTRRWFGYLRDRRREQSVVVARLAAALEGAPADVWQAIESAGDDAPAFVELLKRTKHETENQAPDAALLELLRDRRFRKGKHDGR